MHDRRRVLLGRRGRFVLSILPLIAAFALAEWFVITGAASFTGLLNFLGVVVVSLLAGLFPVLLYVASRRKGEYAPAVASSLLGRPALLAGLYVLFLGALFAHGLVIWDGFIERVFAFSAGVAILAIPAALARGGGFARRFTFEVRDDRRSGSARFAFLAGERPVSATVTLEYEEGEQRPEGVTGEIATLDSLRRVILRVRRDQEALPDQVKLWVHRVTAEGETEALPAIARVSTGGDAEAADLSLSRGEAVFPCADDELEVEIALRESAAQQH